MIKNVYFVENLHGIQYFLSLYEHGESNLIVMSNNNSLHQFIQEIMPNERRIVIPRIPVNDIPFRRYSIRRLFYFFFWRIYHARLLRDVIPQAKAYFFSKSGNIHFFILLGYLSRRGVDINYIDATSGNFYEEPIEAPGFRSQLYLLLLSTIGGVRLSKVITRYWVCLGLASYPTPMAYSPDSWDLLVQKYNWAHKNETERAILLVDGPIQSYPGDSVNVERTQENLIRFFNQLVDKCVEIHLKPHYNYPEINSFSGTFFEKRIRILPAYFPVELIVNQYQEVYYFASVSGSIPIKGTKYSLANLIVFNSKEKRDLFWKLCEDDFGAEITKVEFIRSV